jgi:putative ABC transport system permease protein
MEQIPMTTLFQDLRFALRMLAKSPGFTAVAILTLALGIGANTAIFSIVNAVLLRSLPFPNASQIIDISARSTLFDFTNLGLSLPDIADVRANTPALQSLATFRYSSNELSGEGHPKRLESAEVSEDFFPILGMQPVLGRAFTASDMQPGVDVVILGYRLWQSNFAASPSVIGKSITLDGRPRTVVGVMPAEPELGYATDCELWTPFVPSKEQLSARQNHGVPVIARLKSGVRFAQAQRQLDVLSSRLAAQYPDSDKTWSIHASPIKTFLLGDASAPLAILFAAVGFVLLIACANVSNLFLSRGLARKREFAIRSAVGASRGALVRQIAVECLLVALAGGICAFFVAIWTVHGLKALLPPDIPRVKEIRIEALVAWFTLGASLLAAFISGLAPALLLSRQNVAVAVKQNAADLNSEGSRATHHFLRYSLVVAEIALAAILLVGATLAVRSFSRLLQLDLGFRPDHLVTLQMNFPKFRFTSSGQVPAFVRQVLDESRATPGVTAASAGMVFPMSDTVAESTFQIEGSTDAEKGDDQTTLVNKVTPGFLATLGIPLLAGRDFTDSDGKNQLLVNAAFARQYFGSLNVLGKRINTHKKSDHAEWSEIIGVTGNTRETIPGDAPKPLIYVPLYQPDEPDGVAVYMLVRTSSDPAKIVPAIQERIWSVDKNQTIDSIQTMTERISQVNATPKSQSLLLGIFGALGFILALLGVYGVMSYLVSLQTREFGIRMALGAVPHEILRMVVGHGLKLTLIGVFLGVACALALTHFMRSLLFGISATDPLTFAGVAISLTFVALVACYIPARRATRVDPVIALRYE